MRMLWCKCSTDHRWTVRGAIFGLSYCLDGKGFLDTCCPVSPLGRHLENSGVVGPLILGKSGRLFGRKSGTPVLIFLGNT